MDGNYSHKCECGGLEQFCWSFVRLGAGCYAVWLSYESDPLFSRTWNEPSRNMAGLVIQVSWSREEERC